MKHVFIIGSKGIPAHYGGFETFVENLTARRNDGEIEYHVACAVDEMPEETEFDHNGAHCFRIRRKPIGAAQAITYDIDALDWAIDYAKRNRIGSPVFYVLACRIGPFIASRVRRIHELGGVLLVNPDGNEWRRSKWSAPVRKYWKVSEAGMVRHADLLVCDSENIERYIKKEYARFAPKTVFIPYGAEVVIPSQVSESRLESWLSEHGLHSSEYYLMVGRFVPENNFATVLREFMSSETVKRLVLVTDASGDYLEQLQKNLGFESDSRIRLVGTIYDQELLSAIRSHAFAYIHGHEVGGTNPSLLEALASTKLNLLLDVCFNREVARGSALYWSKEEGSLAKLIHRSDELSENELDGWNRKSTTEIRARYSWGYIVSLYESLFSVLASSRKDFS